MCGSNEEVAKRFQSAFSYSLGFEKYIRPNRFTEIYSRVEAIFSILWIFFT